MVKWGEFRGGSGVQSNPPALTQNFAFMGNFAYIGSPIRMERHFIFLENDKNIKYFFVYKFCQQSAKGWDFLRY